MKKIKWPVLGRLRTWPGFQVTVVFTEIQLEKHRILDFGKC